MKTDRKKIFDKFGGHCAYCGNEIDLCNMQVDHINPRQHPDRDNIENINPSCPICNNWKHCDNLETFRRSIQSQVRKCRDYSRNFRMAERYGLVQEIKLSIVFYFEKL
jgi:5-methylcytosine-specific restriction endonuclease McrA